MSHSRYCSCHRPMPKEIKFDVNADPATFRPSADVSSHLEFVKANTERLEMKLEHLVALQDDYATDAQMPDRVFDWIEVQKQRESAKIEQMMEREHQTNAYLLAERVVHKFVKWGPVRFGYTPKCQNDFYDGSRPINSLDNPVRFEPVFRNLVMKLARDAELNGDQILRNLHLGLASAKRFSEFMDVEFPYDLDQDVDDEDEEADCDCFLCTQESESEDSDDTDSEADSEDEKISQEPMEVVPKPVSVSVPQVSLD
jgi:hypothetical protein